MNMLTQHTDFEPFVGRRFDFVGQHVALRLASVEVVRPRTEAATDHTPFTLVFEGPAGDLLPEGLYQAQIEGGSHTELYVMPIHTVTRDRQTYQAVFN